jgi:Flp pilus assembly protein TadD
LTHASFAVLVIFTTGAAVLVGAQTPSHRTSPENSSVSQEPGGAQLSEAASLLQQGRLAEAEAILRRVLLAAPRNPDAHNLIGVVLDQRGQFKAAETEYRTALRLNRSLISPLANLGVLLARTGRSEEAVRAFETVLTKVPDHPQATLNLGIQYVVRGHYARALPLLERAAQLSGDNYQTRHNVGLALYNLKRYDEAVTAFESASSLSPGSAEPLYYLGLIYWTRHQDEMAAESWDHAVKLRPNFPEANFMLGEVLRKNQRTHSAVEFYQRALDQDSTKFTYYARLGGTYFLLGQHDRALEVFQRAAQRFPKMAEAHHFVGVAARAQADYGLAEAEFRKSLVLRPDNVDTLAQLGFIVGERDRFEEAEKILRRAIAINDKHFYANYDLGRVLVKSKRYEESLTVLRHAATLEPKNPSVHYQLFIALSRLKRKAEAETELAIFKQLDEEMKTHPQPSDDLDVESSDPPTP